MGDEGTEPFDENNVFSVVKDDQGRPVVPTVVPIKSISAELAAKLMAGDVD